MREIARHSGLLAEARDILPALEAALQPSDPEAIIQFLVEATVPFNLSARGMEDAEWAANWRHYLNALERMPLACLEAAMISWNHCEMYPTDKGRHAFYPRPAEFFALAEQHRTKIALMRYRCRKAMEWKEAHTKPAPQERMTKAEMIAAGWLNADGSVNMGKPKTTTQAGDDALRANMASARRAGVPVSASHVNAPGGGAILDDEEAF